jgi:hypothetical protein
MCMQKAGKNIRKENLSGLRAEHDFLIPCTCVFSTVVLIRFVRLFGSIVKDAFSRPNSLKTVLVFSYFAK